MKTTAERLRALRLFEERRAARARMDLDRRDAMIREAIDAGDPVVKIAQAVGVSRTYVYEIRDNRRTGRREA